MKLFLFLAILSLSVHAEVYKCKRASGAIEYQDQPCPTQTRQVIVPITPQSPIEAAKAEAGFEAWKAEQEIQEEIQLEAQKQRQAEIDRQLAVQALQRSAWAQEQQAAAMSQPPVIINQFIPNRPVFRYRPPHPEPFQPPNRDRLFNTIIDNDPMFSPSRYR